MYNPKHFAQTDPAEIAHTIRHLGAAELMTYGSSGIESSFLPLLLNDDATVLRGHFARANQQWKRLDPTIEALICWRGAGTYISPNLYPTKREHGKVVPTWNFVSVQARGKVVIHDDPVWVEDLVRSLTTDHEANSEIPWTVDDAPREYIESMLAAIVGIEVQISSIEAKWKLSQNKPPIDVDGVIEGLRVSTQPGASDIAGLMKQQRDRHGRD
jgi:transcriptional regulator